MAKDEAAEDDEKEKDGGEAEGQAGEEGKKGNKKKLIILLLLLLLLGGGGAGAALFLGGGDKPAEGAHGEAAEGEAHGTDEHGEPFDPAAANVIFVDLDEQLVNLSSSGRRSSFLKLNLSVEVATEPDAQRIKALMPKINDSFQLYLRNLRTEDLEGSAGLARMREELLKRLNAVAAPVEVKDILFKKMLVE
jgi:flagellar FliL protein